MVTQRSDFSRVLLRRPRWRVLFGKVHSTQLFNETREQQPERGRSLSADMARQHPEDYATVLIVCYDLHFWRIVVACFGDNHQKTMTPRIIFRLFMFEKWSLKKVCAFIFKTRQCKITTLWAVLFALRMVCICRPWRWWDTFSSALNIVRCKTDAGFLCLLWKRPPRKTFPHKQADT